MAGPSSSNNDSPQTVNQVTIRFSGDSGDGMQLTGDRFTTTSAIMGNDISTLSDFPAEIRAPAGSVGGVSGFQLTFGSNDVYTAGDQADTLIAMNPAALKVNISHLKKNGILIVNSDTFTAKNIEKAGYDANPLETCELDEYQLFPVAITTMTKAALADTELKGKEVERCKNFFALGVTFWLYQREVESTMEWLDRKFAKKPELADANKKALQGGWNFGESNEIFPINYQLAESSKKAEPGTYRHITGNKAIAFGLVAASEKSGLPLFLGSYPITPATEVLQELSSLKNFNVTTYQAEDEIAAIGATIGAAFGGALAATSTSGPGLALKSEFANLAVITELPIVIINVQRGGPSTGLPTKTEQADLLQALWGRNGESPIVVIAAQSPKDCFYAAYEASYIATKYMTPVMLLSDSNLSNGAEVWKIPTVDELKALEVATFKGNIEDYQPYARDEKTLARPWMIPGTPMGEHRIGGLEKQDLTGNISYDRENHEKMIHYREEKVQRVANDIPPLEVYGNKDGKLLVVGWGSTYGVIRTVVEKLAKQGEPVASTHLRYINPLPKDLEGLMDQYEKVLIPEINNGQLWLRLQAAYGKPLLRYNSIKGYPLNEGDLEQAILGHIKGH